MTTASKNKGYVNKNHAPTNLVPMAQIVADHSQNVRAVDITSEDYQKGIKSLAANIKANDLIQNLVVVPFPLDGPNAGKFRLIAGFRRYEAIKRLKWVNVPCKVVSYEQESEILMASWSENEQRQEMSPFEKARTAGRLAVEHGLSGSQIASKMSVGKGYINNLIRAARELDPGIAEAWREKDPVLTMPNVLRIAGYVRHEAKGKGGAEIKYVPLTGDKLDSAIKSQWALFQALRETKGQLSKALKLAAENPDFAAAEKLRQERTGAGSGAGESEGAGMGAGNEPNTAGTGGNTVPRFNRAEVQNLQDAINKAGNGGKLEDVDAFMLASGILDFVLGATKTVEVETFSFDPTFKPKEDKKDASKAEKKSGKKAAKGKAQANA